ncbi:unnamed protein product [Pleuronectes platessa]|uniref:Uncharacterized protein n=1 Tax=Pleuronectes platessa TaxID=8262 RepID=A0A9N7VLP4_PLEPL|nr:unnamed protein product [Pleuronectes platessa]
MDSMYRRDLDEQAMAGTDVMTPINIIRMQRVVRAAVGLQLRTRAPKIEEGEKMKCCDDGRIDKWREVKEWRSDK